MQTGRTLVLGVDRDDDIGYKAQVTSPVIGREACLNAANRLGLADPEDSDVNAIFQVVRTYDELIAAGEEADVVILAGDHLHMLEGDRKIAADLEEIVRRTHATSCIVVTDGAEDEFVMPIIQSRIPVASIRRVVVSQIPNLEGTYYIIKKLLNDPKVSRFVMVPPGLAMLLYAITYLLGAPEIAIFIVVGAIGSYLLYKGLGLDEMVRDFFAGIRTSLTRGRFSIVTYIVGILIFIIGIVMGLMGVLVHYSLEGSFGLLLYVLTFLYGSILYFTLSGVIGSIGIIIDNFLYEREALGKVTVYPFFIIAIGLIIYCASIYVMSVSNVADFPYTADQARDAIIYGTIGALISSLVGVGLQYMVNKWVLQHMTPPIVEIA